MMEHCTVCRLPLTDGEYDDAHSTDDGLCHPDCCPECATEDDETDHACTGARCRECATHHAEEAYETERHSG